MTGASAGLGRALIERLARSDDLEALIGIDTAGVRIDGVIWRSADVRDPVLAARLAGVDTLVHLATSVDPAREPVDRRALNVRGTGLVLDAARAAGVARVVLVTSAEVYGARAGNPVPLDESAPLAAEPDQSLIGEHLEVEDLVARFRGSGQGRAQRAPDVTVLRPATLVGGPLGRSYDGARLALLAAPRLLALRGVEPLWQLCHADDLLAALELAVRGAVTGAVAVACDGWLRQSEVEALSGRRRLELPAAVALSTAERLQRLGVGNASPRDLDHLMGPLVVAPSALLAAGWTPSWTNEGALRVHLAGRSPADGRAGAYTAAGATMALVGTAALVRRARRRRGR